MNNWKIFCKHVHTATIHITRRSNFCTFRRSKVIDIISFPSFLLMSITFDLRKIQKLLLLKMWIEAFWACLQNIFQSFVTMCCQFFRKRAQFNTKTRSQCFSNEFSQYYWQESFDGDSFVSQSRFDAYATHSIYLIVYFRDHILQLTEVQLNSVSNIQHKD